jgi:hypothetical protein
MRKGKSAMNDTIQHQKSSFTTKAIIIGIVIVAISQTLLPDFSQLKRYDTPTNKTYALSMVQNPEALYITSEYWEEMNKHDNAIRDIRLAIGLLELHTANPEVIQRYKDRLTLLQKHGK